MMNKLSTLALILLLSVLSAEAQNIYSTENLESSSQENLELYLGKAQKLKKTGSVLSIAGSVSAVTGFILAGAGESTFPLGFGMLLAGSGVTLVGLPVLITGSSRVKRVTHTINTRQTTSQLRLVPVSFYEYSNNQLQLGLKLCLKF